jgi:hypothetical protein
MASENVSAIVESANGAGDSRGQKRKKQIETVKNSWGKKNDQIFLGQVKRKTRDEGIIFFPSIMLFDQGNVVIFVNFIISYIRVSIITIYINFIFVYVGKSLLLVFSGANRFSMNQCNYNYRIPKSILVIRLYSFD